MLDRTHTDEVKATLDYLFPDPEICTVCVNALADSIVAADAAGPDGWGITLTENMIRLNVGMIEVLTLHPDWIHIVLDSQRFPEAVRSDSEVELAFERSPGRKGVFSSVPVSVSCGFPAESAPKFLPLVRESHESLIRAAADTRRNPATQKGYSPAVVQYLCAALQRHFGHPKYYSDATTA
jgi:hypothetical protein